MKSRKQVVYDYNNSEKGILHHKQWQEKNKEHTKQQRHGYYLKHKDEIKRKVERYSQTKKGKIVQKESKRKYKKTEKGKIANNKSVAKRKRNLGWIQMFENPFDKDVKIEWHHVTDVYVVAIPKELHQMYNGKHHREKVMSIVKQIYLEV